MPAFAPFFAGYRNRVAASVAALFFLGFAGCVHTEQPRTPAAQANLIITRSQAGTTLSWASVKGQVYTVQMKDRAKPDARWEFHPQAINLVGNGGTMKIQDTPPPGVTRQYRLHLLPVSGSKVGTGK